LIDRIKQFFTAEIASKAGADVEHQQRLATASLMVEIMVIDRQLDNTERDVIRRLLEKQFELSKDEIDQLVKLAHQEVAESTSLYQFTRLINDHFDEQKKVGLIENLWRVAYVDNELDKHEEALIRRIAELIYVSHSDFIRTKHIAGNSRD